MNQENKPAKKTSKLRYALYAVGALILLKAYSSMSGGKRDADDANTSTATPINQSHGTALGEVGKPYTTRYFEVTVNQVSLSPTVVTDNEFTNSMIEKKADQDTVYLIINTTYKNTDTEGRSISAGDLIITVNGKDITFDKAESIHAKGWGLTLETINPMMKLTTNIVFRIPKELKGSARFVPHSRAKSGEAILLGNLQ
jgi:hypothetical protein